MVLTGDIGSWFARFCGSRWYLMIPPTHVTFFSRRTIRDALVRAGFEIQQIEYEGKWVSLDLALFRASYVLQIPLLNTWRSHAPLNWLGRVKFYINFHDVMTVYARKS